MSTITTRTLGKNTELEDQVAVRVNLEDYKDKWGVAVVTITGYATTGTGGATNAGVLDVRSPNHVDIADDCSTTGFTFRVFMDWCTLFVRYIFGSIKATTGFIADPK
jgi:hypothetical protein